MLKPSPIEDAIEVLPRMPWAYRSPPQLHTVPWSLKPHISFFLGLRLSLVLQEPAYTPTGGSSNLLNDTWGTGFSSLAFAFLVHLPDKQLLCVSLS